MKKDYKNPDIKTIRLDQLDVITTSGMGENELNGDKVNKNDSAWSGTF